MEGVGVKNGQKLATSFMNGPVDLVLMNILIFLVRLEIFKLQLGINTLIHRVSHIEMF